MAGAVQRAADRMGELLASTQKTAAQSVNLKAPFDSLANTVSGKMQAGVDKLKKALNPQALALSLALSLGWKLFGDDIMSVLNPAMTVLESFAGLVHSTWGRWPLPSHRWCGQWSCWPRASTGWRQK